MVLPAAAPFLQHRDAVHLGQAQVQHHRVIGLGVAQEMAFLAVQAVVDHIAGIGQRLLQQPLQVLVVFHQKNAHATSVNAALGRRRRGHRRQSP